MRLAESYNGGAQEPQGILYAYLPRGGVVVVGCPVAQSADARLYPAGRVVDSGREGSLGILLRERSTSGIVALSGSVGERVDGGDRAVRGIVDGRPDVPKARLATRQASRPDRSPSSSCCPARPASRSAAREDRS